MESVNENVEFLCLRCGLQGLSEWSGVHEESEFLCPKCGQYVITSHLLKKEKYVELIFS